MSWAEDGGRGCFKSRWHRYPQAMGPARGPVYPEAGWLDGEGGERTVAALGPESRPSNSRPPASVGLFHCVPEPPSPYPTCG